MNERTRRGRWIIRERRRCRRDGFCAVCISPRLRPLLRDLLDLLAVDYYQLKADAERMLLGKIMAPLHDSPEAPPGGVTGRRT